MEVISRASTLNPNAPLFVPLAYRTVEDFSDQWWTLVHSSPWFRDYWIQERFQDPQSDLIDDLEPSFPDDLDSFFFDSDLTGDALVGREEKSEATKDLISVGALKWKGRSQLAQAPRWIGFSRHLFQPKQIQTLTLIATINSNTVEVWF